MIEAIRMQQLAGLDERSIGKTSDSIKIVVDIDKSVHSTERQLRHGVTDIITDDDIRKTTEKAIKPLTKLLVFDKIRIGDDVLIKSKSDLNVVGNLSQRGTELVLRVITVMKKKDFKAKPGTKVVYVQ
jgi:hypothetical protein